MVTSKDRYDATARLWGGPGLSAASVPKRLIEARAERDLAPLRYELFIDPDTRVFWLRYRTRPVSADDMDTETGPDWDLKTHGPTAQLNVSRELLRLNPAGTPPQPAPLRATAAAFAARARKAEDARMAAEAERAARERAVEAAARRASLRSQPEDDRTVADAPDPAAIRETSLTLLQLLRACGGRLPSGAALGPLRELHTLLGSSLSGGGAGAGVGGADGGGAGAGGVGSSSSSVGVGGAGGGGDRVADCDGGGAGGGDEGGVGEDTGRGSGAQPLGVILRRLGCGATPRDADGQPIPRWLLDQNLQGGERVDYACGG